MKKLLPLMFVFVACLFVIRAIVVAFGTDPHIPRAFGWDLAVMASAYGLVISCAAGLWLAMRTVESFEPGAPRRESDKAPEQRLRQSFAAPPIP